MPFGVSGCPMLAPHFSASLVAHFRPRVLWYSVTLFYCVLIFLFVQPLRLRMHLWSIIILSAFAFVVAAGRLIRLTLFFDLFNFYFLDFEALFKNSLTGLLFRLAFTPARWILIITCSAALDNNSTHQTWLRFDCYRRAIILYSLIYYLIMTIVYKIVMCLLDFWISVLYLCLIKVSGIG